MTAREAGRLRPRTFASYAQVVARLHLAPNLGRIPLQRLSPQDVQAWLNDRREAGLSPRTCEVPPRAILRSALGQSLAMGCRLEKRRYAGGVAARSQARDSTTSAGPGTNLTRRCAVQSPGRSCFTVALALGLRQGEALGLKWDAVDFQAGVLQVRAALQRVGKEWYLVEPKSERSRRAVTLPGVAIVALRAHRVHQKKERLLATASGKRPGLSLRRAWVLQSSQAI